LNKFRAKYNEENSKEFRVKIQLVRLVLGEDVNPDKIDWQGFDQESRLAFVNRSVNSFIFE